MVSSSTLDYVLGHFNDKKVALVSTRQRFNVDDEDFNNDNLFYEHMQNGKNKDGAGISTGSGVVYRRSAIEEIGGFQEWNLVEDMYTTYVLNKNGYKSVYVNQAFTVGDAPKSIETIYKQRLTWATDSLRMMIWDCPLFAKKLSFRQKLHYAELGYAYIVSGIVIPLLFILNCYSLVTNTPIFNPSIWYIVFRGISFFVIIKIYNELSQGTSCTRMWAALFPIYFLALIKALAYKKNKYIVTKKGTKAEGRIIFVLPQFLPLLTGYIALYVYIINYKSIQNIAVNIFWLGVLTYWITYLFKYTAIKPMNNFFTKYLQNLLILNKQI